jgi:hypothetical protein
MVIKYKSKFDINKERATFKKELRQRLSTYITAAFGLVAGLAWNDAIRSFIEYIFPNKQNTVTAKFIYAILITILVVIVGTYLLRVLKKED